MSVKPNWQANWTYKAIIYFTLVEQRFRRGATRGGNRRTFPRALNDFGERRKVPTMSQLFNTVHLLRRDLRSKHWDAKFASCPGHHLTSSRPCTFVRRTTDLGKTHNINWFTFPAFVTTTSADAFLYEDSIWAHDQLRMTQFTTSQECNSWLRPKFPKIPII